MLLEREKQLQLVDDLLDEVASSGGKVVLLRGEAGIGKSALVREFLATHADDAHIYFGACDDLLTPQPLGPLRDIAHDQPDLASALAEDDRSAVLATSLDLLSSSLRPNIMVVEDTHWADEATLDVIKYLGRRVARTNGLLLLTYRDGEVDYDHPLRQVIGELPPENLVRMHLDPLSAQAVADLTGDSDLDVERVLALTDGNPLFVTELLTSGVEDVPTSVQDSVLSRAAKLSNGAREVLELVSVIPAGSEMFIVEKILQPTPLEITECVRQGLLVVGVDSLAFHHELTRRSVESALSPHNRRQLNEQVLAVLVNSGDLFLIPFNDLGVPQEALEFDLETAEVHVEIAYHGQKGDADGNIGEWKSDFWTGTECPRGGPAGINADYAGVHDPDHPGDAPLINEDFNAVGQPRCRVSYAFVSEAS